MAVACLALLFALAGTSVAAVTLVIPRNSVGRLQLKANSVDSSKVRNGSLLRADFKARQIPTGPSGPAGPPGPAGPTGPAGPAGAAGVAPPGYVAEVLSQTSSVVTATTSDTFGNLNNASVSVTVPAGETDKLVVFFSAESTCYGGAAVEHCLLRIMVDGNELNPTGTTGADDIFDNNDLGENMAGTFNHKTSDDSEQRGIVRTSGNLSAGSHTVQVQVASSTSTTAFQLDDWALVVQRVKVG